MVFDPLAMNNGNVPVAAVPSAAPPQAFAQYVTTAPPTNNGNVFRDAQPVQQQPMQPIQPMQAQPVTLAKPKSIPQHRTMNSVQRGNDSVLNVLTGEPSPSHSYPASTNSSMKTSPEKVDDSQPGSANASIKPADPFADMPDPFADISGNTFEDATT